MRPRVVVAAATIITRTLTLSLTRSASVASDMAAKAAAPIPTFTSAARTTFSRSFSAPKTSSTYLVSQIAASSKTHKHSEHSFLTIKSFLYFLVENQFYLNFFFFKQKISDFSQVNTFFKMPTQTYT